MTGLSSPARHKTGDRLIYWAAVALALLAVLATLGWRIYSAGAADLGQHYALVRFIIDHWAWPSPAEAYLGPMAVYPPGAHTVAALVGAAFGSPLIGLHLSSLIFLFGIYLALATALVGSVGARLAPLAALLFAALVAIALRFGYTFGPEIRHYYYFAQIAGDAALLGCALLLPAFRPNRAACIAFALIATLVLATIYPLSAIRFAGCVACWTALSLIGDTVRRASLAEWTILAVTLAGCGAIVALHPAFHAMLWIARHEGDINFAVSPALFAPPLLASTIALWLLGRGGTLGFRWAGALAAAGMAVGFAVVAQDLAFRLFGLGSHYAVAKHGYAVGGLLLTNAAVLIAAALRPLFERARKDGGRRSERVAPMLPAALAGLAVLGILPPSDRIDMPREVRAEQAVVRIAHAGAPADLAGNALVLVRDLPLGLGLGFSMGILRLDGWHQSAQELYAYYERRFHGVQTRPYAVVRRDDAARFDAACRLHETEALAVVHVACLKP